jgi:hypothetical protein
VACFGANSSQQRNIIAWISKAQQPYFLYTQYHNQSHQSSKLLIESFVFKMSSPSSSVDASSLDEKTCHVLPCNIDYQGMAPTHLYFQPAESQEGIYSSSMFRGRGLLATRKSGTVKAALLSVKNDQVQVKAEIDNILEWHHEHHPETMQMEEASGGRVDLAQAWSEVAVAVSDQSRCRRLPFLFSVECSDEL